MTMSISREIKSRAKENYLFIGTLFFVFFNMIDEKDPKAIIYYYFILYTIIGGTIAIISFNLLEFLHKITNGISRKSPIIDTILCYVFRIWYFATVMVAGPTMWIIILIMTTRDLISLYRGPKPT